MADRSGVRPARTLVAPAHWPHLSRWIQRANHPSHSWRRRLHKLSSYLPAILWAALILGIGSLHHVPVPNVNFPIDKVGHFGMYSVLGALTGLGWARNGHMPHILIPLFVAASVGAIDEIHQRYVPGRSSELADFGADVAGVCIGFTFAVRFRAAAIGTE